MICRRLGVVPRSANNDHLNLINGIESINDSCRKSKCRASLPKHEKIKKNNRSGIIIRPFSGIS
jgi:hypothetical protein